VFNEELLTYLKAQRGQAMETMRRNTMIGREDFYTLGQIAVFDQIIHYIHVRGDLNV
jgi:hypothetical protein